MLALPLIVQQRVVFVPEAAGVLIVVDEQLDYYQVVFLLGCVDGARARISSAL
mgnify:CR=1 FL=1